ncbi:MAG: polyphosphate kinase 1 [Acidobacteria bacterium]|nr:polyphosphate kinase 1 [Acidobacteriota bacterium]
MAAHLESFIEGPSFADDTRYLNRELSWLDFNARVLSLADVPTTPVLERARFLGHFAQNLDEFFQVRVAGLDDQAAAGLGAVSPEGQTPAEQLTAIRDRVEELIAHQDRIFLDEVAPALAGSGIQLSDWDTLDDDDRAYLVEVFERQVFPVLTPLSVDPGHPFPYISDLSLNLGVMVRDPTTDVRRFARVKVPDLLPRFVVMPDGERYVPLEQVIAAHLEVLFPGMRIEAHHPFRVTRNADFTLEEAEADDLLEAVELELRRRRFGRAVRLEVMSGFDEEILDLLLAELALGREDVFVTRAPLDLGGLMSVYGLARPDLKYESWRAVSPPGLVAPEGDAIDIFERIRARDILAHHPYESFTSTVTAFIRAAAADPKVLAIKQTLYRTSADSPIVQSLISAVEAGKQVAALVEIKARFDEKANVAWARALEEAGVHVVYGLMGLKTHSKTALVVRQDDDGIRRYCHIGTGNYNERTARSYEDIGVLTCDPQVGADLTQLFNYLTGYARQERFRRLLVAPGSMRPRLISLIENEASVGGGRIVMKMNHLVDVAVIDALYAASQAGVEIDLVVRTTCCLRPGIPGLSENIRVRSLVGRFLEHSRIYHFANGNGRAKPAYYVGSADLMPRNLDRRVEALLPIDDPALQARLHEILSVNLADDELAWVLSSTGSWQKVPTEIGVNTQSVLQQRARDRRKAGAADGPRRLH